MSNISTVFRDYARGHIPYADLRETIGIALVVAQISVSELLGALEAARSDGLGDFEYEDLRARLERVRAKALEFEPDDEDTTTTRPVMLDSGVFRAGEFHQVPVPDGPGPGNGKTE